MSYSYGWEITDPKGNTAVDFESKSTQKVIPNTSKFTRLSLSPPVSSFQQTGSLLMRSKRLEEFLCQTETNSMENERETNKVGSYEFVEGSIDLTVPGSFKNNTIHSRDVFSKRLQKYSHYNDIPSISYRVSPPPRPASPPPVVQHEPPKFRPSPQHLLNSGSSPQTNKNSRALETTNSSISSTSNVSSPFKFESSAQSIPPEDRKAESNRPSSTFVHQQDFQIAPQSTPSSSLLVAEKPLIHQSTPVSIPDVAAERDSEVFMKFNKHCETLLAMFKPLHETYEQNLAEIMKSPFFISMSRAFAGLSIDSNSNQIASRVSEVLWDSYQQDPEKCKLFAIQFADRIIQSGPTRVERLERNSPERSKYAFMFARIISNVVNSHSEFKFILDIVLGCFFTHCSATMITQHSTDTRSSKTYQKFTGYLSIYAALLSCSPQISLEYTWCWLSTLCDVASESVVARIALDSFVLTAIPRIGEQQPMIAKEMLIPILSVMKGNSDTDSIGTCSKIQEYLIPC